MPLRQRQQALLLVILILSAAIRIIGFVSLSPPGPEHDEVANWLIDRAILAGEHAVYFTQAYGHEAGFHYWQTLFVWLVGDNLVALRAPAALMGVLSVAVTYALNKRLFGRNMAILITALVATLFMPVFYSRLALRAISLPVMAGIAACFFWDWLKTGRQRFIIFAALFAGLSSYTYLASRALPIFFIGWFVALALLHQLRVGHTWRSWFFFAAVYLLVSLPLILFLQNPANIETRIGEVDAPLRALLAGDLRPVLQNGLAILSGFGFSGDPLWRQGVAFQPIFDPVFGALFYFGLLVCLWKIKDMRYSFLLIWLGASVIPSVLTVDAPSTIRMILMLPVTGAFPIVGINQILTWFGFSLSRTKVPKNPKVIHSYPQLSTRKGELSTTKLNFTWLLLLTLVVLVFQVLRTTRNTFQIWPNSSEVQFVWQQALTEIGRDIDQTDKITNVSIAGWTPDTMDDPTLELVTQREDVTRRHFGKIGTIETLVLPPHPHTVYRPTDLPFASPLIDEILNNHSIEEKGMMTAYTSAQVLEFEFASKPAAFKHPNNGNSLFLLGTKFVKNEADQILLLSVWQVDQISAPDQPNTKLFAHLVDGDGTLLAQHDGLDAPHRFWQESDLLVQLHTLPNDPAGVDLRLGVYVGAPPWQRFVRENGADFVSIPLFTAEPLPTETPAPTATLSPSPTATLDPTATPSPTSTPLPTPTPSAHTPDRRTGEADLDMIIDAALQNEVERLKVLLQFSQIACTTRDGLGGPPKCQEEQNEGDILDALPILGAEGQHLLEKDLEEWDGLIQGIQLFAVYKLSDAVYSDLNYPAGEIGILFATQLPDMSLELHVSNGRLVRIDYRMGKTPSQVAELDAVEFILPPP